MSVVDKGFDAAFAASVFSDAPRVGLKMGACLMVGSRILAIGANLYSRSHPASRQSDAFTYSTHAEHVALLRRQHYDAPKGRLTMYVARRRSDGSIGNSKPCLNCMRLCNLSGIARIWYFEDGTRKVLVF